MPEGSPVPDEDALAFFRDEAAFRNVRFVEPANGDFAVTVARLLVFSSFRLALFQRLARSSDAVLAAVAAKGVKELTYHRDYAGRWFLTLAQGTEESRRRLLAGLDLVWPLHDELFRTTPVERAAAEQGVGVDPASVLAEVGVVLEQVFSVSGVERPRLPPTGAVSGGTGRDGRHTETMGTETAHRVAATVVDPEMPMLTLADLGVLRDVREEDGRVVVTITPTYSGCPAMATMRDDLVHRLHDHGYADVEVRVNLAPAWSSDWITERGRRALVEHGLSAPGPAPRHDGLVVLTLAPMRRSLTCPRCASDEVELTSEFGATACKALYRCSACLEPFEHVKEI